MENAVVGIVVIGSVLGGLLMLGFCSLVIDKSVTFDEPSCKSGYVAVLKGAGQRHWFCVQGYDPQAK